MPAYELAVILRKLPRQETATVLKRAALKIFENDGILFGIENLGTRKLPFRMRNHGHWNSEGSYFLMKFDSPPRAIGELQEEYDRDVDIVRTGFSKIFSHPEYDCTLEDELQPPAYREEVKQMLTTGRKKERKFEYKTGLPYNPFRF